MKNLSNTIIILLLLISGNIFSQLEKYHGGINKPSSTAGGKPLHALVIFVTFTDDKSGWGSASYPPYANELFDNDTSDGIKPFTLTEFWYNMSGGRFVFTGEVYPEVITLRPEEYYRDTRRNFSDTNIEALKAVKDKIDFKKFDNWSFDYRDKKFVPEPDGIADMLFLIYPNPGADWFTRGIGEDFSAVALLGSKDFEVVSRDKISIIGKRSLSRDNSGITVRAGLKTKMELIEILSHEYGHFLFGSGHTKIGGLMGGGTFGMNAWEKMALGYLAPIVIDSDAVNLKLSDFLETGEFIKINYPIDKLNSNTFFILENHSRTNKYDFICRGGPAEGKYTTDGDFGKGIYVYKVLNGNHYPPNIEMLTADGLWKWNIIDTVYNSPLCGCDVPVFYRLGPDKLNGKSDRMINIYFNKALWPMWYDRDYSTNKYILSRDNMGDEFDAFTPGMVFSPWSNPSSDMTKRNPSGFGFYVENIDSEGNVTLTIKTNKQMTELPPAKPAGISIEKQDDILTLEWQANSEPRMMTGGVYRVYRQIGNNDFKTIAEVSQGENKMIIYQDNIQELGANKVTYKIQAVDSAGNISVFSDPVLYIID